MFVPRHFVWHKAAGRELHQVWRQDLAFISEETTVHVFQKQVTGGQYSPGAWVGELGTWMGLRRRMDRDTGNNVGNQSAFTVCHSSKELFNAFWLKPRLVFEVERGNLCASCSKRREQSKGGQAERLCSLSAGPAAPPLEPSCHSLPCFGQQAWSEQMSSLRHVLCGPCI